MKVTDSTTALTTEERIREAARKVFLAKGYDGTTSRDLAEASGLNVAMTNYYFRSKEKLFQLTFEDFHRKFFEKTNKLVNEAIPLRDKVALMIDNEYELVEENPDLPMFVMYEMRRNPSFFCHLKAESMLQESLMARQIAEAVASGELKPIDGLQVMLLIKSNVHHPFIARSIFTTAFGMDEAGFASFMATHKQTVKDMLLTYLFGPEKAS